MARRDGPKSIYALVDPRDGKVRYVGASEEPEKRYKQHIVRSGAITRIDRSRGPEEFQRWRDEGIAFGLWIQELDHLGLKPDLRLLSDSVDNWREVEREFQRQHGATLLNPNAKIASYQHDAVGSLVGHHLAEVRNFAGLSQTQAAAQLNTTQATVSRWESGARMPSLVQLYRISAAYGVSTSSLIPDINTSISEGDDSGTTL